MIIVVDFGSQTAHLIVRRINELGVEAKLVLPENALKELKKNDVRGIVFSGGPASVYAKNSPTVDKQIFGLRVPILGICYGLQLISYLLGGNVKAGAKKEFGPANLTIIKTSKLFNSLTPKLRVWMSHGDEVISLPSGFARLGRTETLANAAAEDEKRKIYGIQFHPEVMHTEFGEQILDNFLKICGLEIKKVRIDKQFVQSLIKDIKDSIKDKKAICALSGGIDSSVAAILTSKAIGTNLNCIYVDSGLMRQGETKELKSIFSKHHNLKIKIVKTQNKFLKNLKGVVDPEKKRRIIGKTFIHVLENEAQKIDASFLIQGTIYPDVIESAGTKHSHKIKSHHNVGGLPKKMNLFLVEPLRNLYKDQVKEIAKILKLPEVIINRQPFPGPGLAIRIIGGVTNKKLQILRQADVIVQEEIGKYSQKGTLWQAFAVLTGIKTTGVRGDVRAYGETIGIRAIVARDAMTAHWARLPYDLLDRLSTRIVNEIKEVNRVVYDITNKPPSTMEWE